MGSVIRRESVPSPGLFTFPDMEAEAKAILARARAEARKLIAEGQRRAAAAEEHVRQQAQRRYDEAYQHGLAEGRRAGREAAFQEARQEALTAAQGRVAELIRSLEAGLAEFERHKRSLLATAESGLIELALAVARRVCKIESARSVVPAQANARALLERVQQHGDVELRFHPDDHALLETADAAWLEQSGGRAHVTILADPAVERGGCVLRCREVRIDATLRTQLDRLAAVLCEHPTTLAETPGDEGPTPAAEGEGP